ncbi:MAG: DUF362 domain-containing protein [Planctomycetota bacterium]|nr:DUF362 domain-containing protein [Planctomycetota bacterium]
MGKRKAAYHLHVRESRELFARLMMDLAQIVSPVLNIVDGVEAMEGNGPGSGEPRKMNFIAASEEAWALDLLCAWLTGFSADEVPILKEYAKDAARQKQLLDIDVVGHDWRELMAEDFKRAKSFSLSFRIPAILRRPLNRLVLPRPHVNSDKCVACGDCAESCPANVIKVTRKAKIKLGGCIRCFCCQEVCPVKAIDIRHPLLSFLRK